MSQQKGMSFKEFRRSYKQRKPVRHTCLSSAGRKDLSARSVEVVAATGFADGVSMSANSAIVKARPQREPFYTVPIFR